MNVRIMLTQALGLSLLVLACGQQDIRMPPEITKPLSSQKIFLGPAESKTFRLQCTSDGRPKPTYTWYSNHKLIGSSKRISVDSNTGQLNITDFSAEDDGLYNCHVNVTFTRNRWAVAVSPTVEVTLARIEEWPIRKQDLELQACKGCYLLVPCDEKRPKSYGPFQSKWETFSTGEVINDLNHFIDRNGDLHIFFVKDDKDRYTYYCGMSNFYSKKQVFGRKTTVVVSDRSNPANSKPVLRYYTGLRSLAHLTFERESDARLECVCSGYESDPTATKIDLKTSLPNISWVNDRNDIIVSGQDRYEITNYGRVLTIKNLVESDERKYRCVASNSFGRAEASMPINVTSAPIWVKPLKSMTVTQGQDALFHCQTRSAKSEQPPSPPTWYRNGLRFDVDYDPTKYHFSDQMRALNVTSAQKLTDIACFRCFVSNSVGQVVSAACLNVILPLEIIARPKGSQVVDRAIDADLTVVARSDPLTPLTYLWHFKNKTYSADDAPPHVEYNDTTKLAVIRTRKLTDDELLDIRGVYTREIFNRFQRETVETKVITGRTTGEECTDHYYGPNCTYCGKCADHKPCDKFTGRCEACEPGYLLPYCGLVGASQSGQSTDSDTGMMLILASVIAALIIALILIAVCLYRKRSKPAIEEPQPQPVDNPEPVMPLPPTKMPDVVLPLGQVPSGAPESVSTVSSPTTASSAGGSSVLSSGLSTAETGSETGLSASGITEYDTDTGDVIFADPNVYAELNIQNLSALPWPE